MNSQPLFCREVEQDDVDSRLGGGSSGGGEERRKPVTPQKPSLSASFLEQKRRLRDQAEAVRPHTADSPAQRWAPQGGADAQRWAPQGGDRQEVDEVMIVDPQAKR
jgi:hypothetical protein